MKDKPIFEDQIKIIKASSKHSQNREHPQFVKDKRSESSQQYSIKIMHINKQNEKPPFFHKHSNNKVVVIETLENDIIHNQATKNSIPSCKQKHKKGKSMDLTAQKSLTTDRNHLILDQKLKNIQKDSIPSCIINEFRYKSNISEMKDYNVSKRLESTRKKWSQLPVPAKKKKIKLNFSGEFRQLRNEMKGVISTQPGTKRKTSTGKISNQTFKQKNISKQIAVATKSVQFPFERRQKWDNEKDELFVSKLLRKGVTMPLSSKLQSLYSNTTSLFSSRANLSYQTHRYAIPTEQSVDQIFEIRQFQSLALTEAKNSSTGFRKLSYQNFMKELGQNEVDSTQKATQDLISNFVKMINCQGKSLSISNISKQIEKSMDFSNVSKDLAYKNENFRHNKQSLHTPSNSQQIDKSVQAIRNKNPEGQLSQKEKELEKLNEIIHMIKKKQVISNGQKYQILQKMKEMLSQVKNEQVPFQGQIRRNFVDSQVQRQAKPFISNSEGSNINLQILDKILRERQQYLFECRQREIQNIEKIENQIGSQQSQIQKQKIYKRSEHEIKEVVHTRLQLWKGFNFADKLLSDDKGQRKREMMKCLSERYLNHSKSITMVQKKQQNRMVDANKADCCQRSQLSKNDKEICKNIECIKQSEILHDKVLQFLNQKSYHFENEPQSILPNNQMPVPQKDKSKSGEQILKGLLNFSKHSIINQDEEIVTPHQNQPPHEQIQQNLDYKNHKIGRLGCEADYDYPFHNFGELTSSIEDEEIIPSLNSPFGNLTLQKKEDICQFVFLDLCIEVTEDYSRNSPLINHIFNFINRAKQQSKRQKGFKTNSTAIKEYLHQLISFLKSQHALMEQIHHNLDEPIGPSALQILKFMHATDESQQPQEQSQQNINILNPTIFQQFQQIFIRKFQFQKYYEEEQKQKKRILFLKNALHVHNKAIFDTLNERLDLQRPFGLWGQPFSWKKTPKFYHGRSTEAKNCIYSSAQRAIQFGTYLCGFMVDKQDCAFRDNPNVTESYIEQVRIDRLSRMLAQQLQQDEQKMQFIDDEQTEFQVQISEAIWNKLLLEFCSELLLA